MKKTLVIGASVKPERYSNKAIYALKNKGHEVIALSTKSGQVDDIVFETEHKQFKDLDTVTLYIGSRHQDQYSDYILNLSPKRVIFNPGTENEALATKFRKHGIEVENACTLVLLSLGVY